MDTLKPQNKTVKDKLDIVHYTLFQSPRKAATWIIILLIVLNITLRIPTTPYPVSTDTYKALWEVKGLINQNEHLHLEKGAWKVRYGVFNPEVIKSYLPVRGPKFFYPFTDPFIYQLNLATIHLITTLGLMNSMLLICMLCGVLAFLTSYMMAKSFVESKFMVYIISFTYSTAPTFLHSSTWQGTFRTLFVSLLPLLFWCFFKYEKEGKRIYLVFSIFLAFALFSIHRMGLMIPLIFIAYLIVKVYIRAYTLVDGKNVTFDRILMYLVPVFYSVLLTILLVYPFFSSLSFFKSLMYEYETGLLTEGLQAPRVLLNMVIDYYSSEGFLMVFSLIGLIILLEKLRRPVKNINYVFISVVLLSYSPFLLQGEYLTVFMLPVFSILISLGVKGFVSFSEMIISSFRLDYRIPQFIVLGLILSSCGFSIFMNHWWTNTPVSPLVPVPTWMDERVRHAATYLNNLEGRVLIPQFTNLLTQFSAMVSEYDKIFFGWENYGWSFHTNQNMLVLYDFNITYVVEYGLYNKSWTNMAGDVGTSPLLIDLDNERDRVFSNGLIGIYDSRFDDEQSKRIGDMIEWLREHTPGVRKLPPS